MRRGGVLLDLFLIFLIIGAGAAGWIYWKREASPIQSLLPALLGKQDRPAESSTPDIDVSDRAAWIQARTRDLLAKLGVKERHVLKSYNAQRQEGGIQWLEDTLEVRRPPAFDDDGFLRSLAPALAEKSLSLMDDRREGARRTLELGDRRRVYQRIVFVSAH